MLRFLLGLGLSDAKMLGPEIFPQIVTKSSAPVCPLLNDRSLKKSFNSVILKLSDGPCLHTHWPWTSDHMKILTYETMTSHDDRIHNEMVVRPIRI